MPVVVFAEGDLPASSRWVFEALGDLAAEVPIDRWCLIGGLMVEVVVRSRGRTPLRPTDDGDVVGDVRADRAILATISEALRRASFELVETGMDGEFGVRHRRGDGTTIDLLAPENRAARPRRRARRRAQGSVAHRRTLREDDRLERTGRIARPEQAPDRRRPVARCRIPG